MELKTFGQRYLRVFFLLGQSAFNPKFKLHEIPSSMKFKQKLFHLIQYIPSLMYLFYVILTCIFFLQMFSSDKFSFSYGVYSFFTLSKLLTCITVLTCSPFFPNNLQKLWLKFEHVERYTSRILYFHWSFKQCQRNYVRKVILTAVLLLSRIISKFALRHTLPFYSFFSYSLTTTSIIANLHILFYVDLYEFMLRTINKKLSNIHRSNDIFKIPDKSEKSLSAQIEMYKSLHFKLWEICNLINLNFGWILVSIFLQTMSNFLNPIYWIVIDFYEDDFSKELQVISMFYRIFVSLHDSI